MLFHLYVYVFAYVSAPSGCPGSKGTCQRPFCRIWGWLESATASSLVSRGIRISGQRKGYSNGMTDCQDSHVPTPHHNIYAPQQGQQTGWRGNARGTCKSSGASSSFSSSSSTSSARPRPVSTLTRLAQVLPPGPSRSLDPVLDTTHTKRRKSSNSTSSSTSSSDREDDTRKVRAGSRAKAGRREAKACRKPFRTTVL